MRLPSAKRIFFYVLNVGFPYARAFSGPIRTEVRANDGK